MFKRIVIILATFLKSHLALFYTMEVTNALNFVILFVILSFAAGNGVSYRPTCIIVICCIYMYLIYFRKKAIKLYTDFSNIMVNQTVI